MKPRTLSREEEAELARSNKKVKDSHHAEFREGLIGDSPASEGHHRDSTTGVSFKDKLVGVIPGAYVKAFEFDNLMEEDEESDGEGEVGQGKLREGWVSVQLTKETKQRLRGTWSKAIIVKLVGRTIGLSYMRTKLGQLWRPTGRMDCVDLGSGFFLVRFFSKEDLEAVLMRGPWFIGDHFLSIRPWEPFFKPSTANVSLIAVWVRLCELPFELYETEVLRQIGESVGKVLRIDSHTALEARGKYARLCIQIDINKPLVTTILIGRFEQPVSYEGIQNLCFSCGRLGHRVEACPFTIRKGGEKLVPQSDLQDDKADEPCETHAPQAASQSVSASSITPDVCEAAEAEGVYGPWMVVQRRFSGRKGTKSNLGTDSTATPVQSSLHHLPPTNLERKDMAPSGPMFSQGMARGGVKQGLGDHVLKRRTSSTKASGPRERLPMNHGNVSILGPLKSSPLPNEPLGFEMGQGLHSDHGSSAQSHKRTPSSVKGKKTLARSIRPKPDLINSATHQWKLSSAVLTSLKAADGPSGEANRTSDNTFEFAAVEARKSEQDSGGSNDTQVLGDRHDNNPGSDGQRPFNRLGHDLEVAGMLSDPSSREGSDYEDVGDERMVSEEGVGAPPTA